METDKGGFLVRRKVEGETRAEGATMGVLPGKSEGMGVLFRVCTQILQSDCASARNRSCHFFR